MTQVKQKLSQIMEMVLKVIFIGGLGIYITLPFCLKWYLEFTQLFSTSNYVKILVLLYASGILALAIVFFTIKLLKNVNANTPFIMDNVKIFKKIGVCSLVISIFYLISIPIIKSFFTIILFMIFVLMGFISLVLADVFEKAIQYKEENDLTI